MALNSETLLARADRLARRGQRDEARAAYLEVLKLAPDHFGALNNLGALLHDMNYRNAARTAYARAVACHPQNPVGHVNLANALRGDEDLAAARDHAEMALQLCPGHPGAHQAMAGILFDLGDFAAAARHRDIGYRDHDAMHLPYRGKGKPVSLLMLVSAVGGNVPIRHLIDDTLFETTVIYADYWTRALPRHDLVFNAIGDADLVAPAMHAAAKLLAKTKAPVLNSPGATLRTGRSANAARLAHLPGVRTARTVQLARAKIAEHGLTYPLLLRSPGFHTGEHFERVESPEQLTAIAAKLPGDELMAMEYLDARGADGRPRKYRVMFVNGQILPLHLCISNDWKVHYFTSAMADNEASRDEEKRFLDNMPMVLGDKAMTALAAVRDALGLDYAGIDFALNADGEVLLFEANATMVILPPGPDARWDYRRAAIAKVENAVRAMLAKRAPAKHALAA
jgi:glutathione synthase/RimK-type ligase-like ATP-grasp enzyme